MSDEQMTDNYPIREQVTPYLAYWYFKATPEEKAMHGSDVTVVPVWDKRLWERPLRPER